MRTKTLITVIVIGLLSSGGLQARKPKGNQPLPAYHVGITGLYVVPDRKVPEVTVSSLEPRSPAAGKFTKGDVIIAANGVKLAQPDSRVQLGNAITAAEAADGKLTFTIKRGGSTKSVTITLPVLGAYSKTWPADCAKTRKIVDAAAAHAVKLFTAGKMSLPSRRASLNVLFLLSTGKAEHVKTVKSVVHAYVKAGGKVGSHTWNNGFLSLALGEYYLR
ncbi:MAG: PDZ domain-containing protein, partial [bacterium]|nr:PDZ domain-containing protein [bacterium]